MLKFPYEYLAFWSGVPYKCAKVHYRLFHERANSGCENHSIVKGLKCWTPLVYLGLQIAAVRMRPQLLKPSFSVHFLCIHNAVNTSSRLGMASARRSLGWRLALAMSWGRNQPHLRYNGVGMFISAPYAKHDELQQFQSRVPTRPQKRVHVCHRRSDARDARWQRRRSCTSLARQYWWLKLLSTPELR